MQVTGGEIVQVLLHGLLLNTKLQSNHLFLALFLDKELQQGPELQEAGGQASHVVKQSGRDHRSCTCRSSTTPYLAS